MSTEKKVVLVTGGKCLIQSWWIDFLYTHACCIMDAGTSENKKKKKGPKTYILQATRFWLGKWDRPT